MYNRKKIDMLMGKIWNNVGQLNVLLTDIMMCKDIECNIFMIPVTTQW